MVKKLYIKTYGCQMNQYDSSKIFDILMFSHKFKKTDSVQEADLIILNTCSIREKPQEKVFSQLGQWKNIKCNNANVLIGVGGCVASQEGKNIIKRAPFVDFIFGPQTYHRLPKIIDYVLKHKKSIVDVSFPEIEKFDYFPTPNNSTGPIALVSIIEGCNKYCSYCIVPYTRGEEISRTFDDILDECYRLSLQGVKEINLLGQNVNDYQGVMYDGNIADLSTLIEYISCIDNISRIRFTTSHPKTFSNKLIYMYKKISKLVNHLHLPIQSGSNKILNLMKRDYTVEEYKEKIYTLKKIRPNIKISTDIIVGFPGETNEDFEQTLDVVKEMRFDTSYSFIFSKRPGTPAENLIDTTSIYEKKQRLKKLQTILSSQSIYYNKKMIGNIEKVLVTGYSKKNIKQLSGRTECNRVVNFYGDSKYIGNMVNVHIEEALPNSLRGTFIELCV